MLLFLYTVPQSTYFIFKIFLLILNFFHNPLKFHAQKRRYFLELRVFLSRMIVLLELMASLMDPSSKMWWRVFLGTTKKWGATKVEKMILFSWRWWCGTFFHVRIFFEVEKTNKMQRELQLACFQEKNYILKLRMVRRRNVYDIHRKLLEPTTGFVIWTCKFKRVKYEKICKVSFLLELRMCFLRSWCFIVWRYFQHLK